MKLTDQRVIFAGQAGTQEANCCFPAIVRMPDGTLVASWRAGTSKDSADGRVMLSRSADDGCTWSDAQLLPLGPYADMPGEAHYGPLTALGPGHLLAAIMWVDRSIPELPLFHPDTEGLLPVRTLFCESHDGGITWDDYRELDHAPYNSPMPITGPVLELAGGRLACQFEVNKNYEETQPWRHAAAWKISSDGGHTWPEHVEIACDSTDRLMYWDARYAMGQERFCLAAFWTYDRRRQQDANIHLSFSHDDGHEWNPPRDTGIAGQVAHPLLLRDGRLLLVYVDRFHTQGIRAVLSDNLGQTFHSETIVYQHPCRSQNQNNGERAVTLDYLQQMDSWTFGRVDAMAEPDGNTLIVFYAGNPEATNIHLARLNTRSTIRRRDDQAEVCQGQHVSSLMQEEPFRTEIEYESRTETE